MCRNKDANLSSEAKLSRSLEDVRERSIWREFEGENTKEIEYAFSCRPYLHPVNDKCTHPHLHRERLEL